jgi:hypothetical protein
MPLNVLLMLSSRQSPAPEVEIDHHLEALARGEPQAYLATTRVLTDLVPGEGAVAFYGDSHMNNKFLGIGRFDGYLPISSIRAAELLRTHPLYSTGGVPTGLRGFVILSKLRKPKQGETLDKLADPKSLAPGARLRAGGKKLNLENIPPGPARTAVYFWTEKPVRLEE